MSVSVTQFRGNFPAFSNVTTYPDAQVTFWMTQAALLHNPTRWGGLLDLGIQLWTAHNLIIEGQAAKQSQNGRVPTGGTGVQSSKSVDKVSVSYDNSTTKVEGAESYNATVYGQRWYKLSKMAGAGPLQSGLPSPSDPSGGSGWPGFIYPMP